MSEVILINLTGPDRPGITRDLSAILARHDVRVLDIGQAVIHDYLSLGILVEIQIEFKSSSILKDLLFEAHKLGIQIRFSPIEEDRYEKWVTQQGKERRFITLLGRRITADQLSKVAAAIAKNKLNSWATKSVSFPADSNILENTYKICWDWIMFSPIALK